MGVVVVFLAGNVVDAFAAGVHVALYDALAGLSESGLTNGCKNQRPEKDLLHYPQNTPVTPSPGDRNPQINNGNIDI